MRSIESAIRLRKDKIGVNSDGKEKHSSKTKLDGKNKVDGNEIDSNKVEDNKVIEEKNHQKTFKSKKLSKSKKTIRSLDFFTLRAKLVFTKLRQAFVKALIFHYFDLEYLI